MSLSGRRPVIYLVGTAGNPHFGDEVITAGWLRYYADVFPDAEVWLDTPRPGSTSVLHGDTHPHLRCVDTLFHAAWNAPSENPEECLRFGAEVIDEPGRIPREASGVAAAKSADLIHILGGGYINTIWPRHLALIGAARRIADSSGARTAMTGAGLTPNDPSALEPLADALGVFDVVDVRDDMSRALLESGSVAATMTGDDALLDLQRQRVDASRRPRTIVEVQSDLIDAPLDELAAQVVRLLRDWDVASDSVVLLESLPPNDVAVAEYLQPELPDLSIRPFEFLWREGFPLSPDHRFVTTRFHTHLLGAASGAWGVALGASDMIADQHQSLLDHGSEWTLSTPPFEGVAAQPPSRQPFGGRFADLVAGKRAVAERVVALLRP